MKIKIAGRARGFSSSHRAIYYFYKFVTFTEEGAVISSGWIALGLAAVAFVCGLIYFLGHVNQEEEIHISREVGDHAGSF